MEFLNTIIEEITIRPVFWMLSIFMLFSGFMVVTLKNIFHCAIYLILCLFSVAGLYILLNAEFLAVAQVLIYVGAVSILMIFAIMLSSNFAKEKIRMTSKNALPVSLVCAVFALSTISIIVITKASMVIKRGGTTIEHWSGDKGTLPLENTEIIGKYLMTEYMLPFEVVSILLLAAMIGAIVLARKERS